MRVKVLLIILLFPVIHADIFKLSNERLSINQLKQKYRFKFDRGNTNYINVSCNYYSKFS